MTVECDHDFAPGNQAKDLRWWETSVCEAKCTKCGFVHPDLQIMPREVWGRRVLRRQYKSLEEFEIYLREEIRRDPLSLRQVY